MVVFEDILKEDPNNVEALLGMGVCLTYLIVCSLRLCYILPSQLI